MTRRSIPRVSQYRPVESNTDHMPTHAKTDTLATPGGEASDWVPEGINQTPFVVKLTVPMGYSRDVLAEALPTRNLNGESVSRITSHYWYLLRLNSWTFGIDWIPQESVVTLTVPNTLAEYQQTDENGTLIDGLSGILYQIVGNVSVDTLLKHFDSNP